MKKVKGILILLTVALAFTVFIAQSQAREEFKLGITLPLSGPGSSYGIPTLHSIEMAVEEINEKGGVTVAGKQYDFKLVVYDDKCTPTEGLNVLEKLISRDRVKVILGPVCSGNISALAPKIGDRVIILTVGTVVSDYTQIGNPNIFRPHVSVQSVSGDMTNFLINDLGIRTVGICAGKSSWSTELLPVYKERFPKAGGKVWAEWVDLGSKDLYPTLTSLWSHKPDAIGHFGYPPQAALTFKQIHELGFTPKHRFSISSGGAADFLRVTSADILEGIYDLMAASIESRIEAGNKRAAEFKKTFMERYKIEPLWGAGCNGYDVVYIVKHGLENAGSVTDLVKIRTGLQSIGEVPEAINDYPAVNGRIWNEKNEAYFQGAAREFHNGEFRLIRFLGAFK